MLWNNSRWYGPLRFNARSVSLTIIVLTLAAPGCSTYRQADRDVERAVAAWRRDRLHAAAEEAQFDPRPPASPAPAVVASPSSPDSHNHRDARLSTIIRTALERNPSIQAAVANVQAKRERIPQVTSLPDPVLRAVTRPEPIQTAVGDVYFTLGLTQMIPFPPRLDHAGRVAAAEVRMAIEQLNATRLRVIADVERAYLSLYLMDRFVELTAANRSLLEDLERVVTAQYEVGRVPQQDVLRVQSAAAGLRDDEHRYALRRDSAAAALNQIMDVPVAQEHALTKPLDLASLDFDVQELIRLAEQYNPDLAVLAQQLERDREQIELAEFGYWPDLTLGFEWNYLKGRQAFVPPPNPQTGVIPPYNRASENGDDNWAVTLQMNLPIWTQRIQAAKRQARAQLLKTQHEQRAARNLTDFRVFDAFARVEAQQQTIQLLQATLIPQARQTYEVTLTAYQTGTTGFLNVIDAWRGLLNFELMSHRETVDLEIAFSDLQKEVGLLLISTPDSPSNIEE